MSNHTPSIAIIVEGYGEWGDSDREVVKRIKRANIAIDHDTAQAVAIEREAAAAMVDIEWQNAALDCRRSFDELELLRDIARAIRNGEHHKP